MENNNEPLLNNNDEELNLGYSFDDEPQEEKMSLPDIEDETQSLNFNFNDDQTLPDILKNTETVSSSEPEKVVSASESDEVVEPVIKQEESKIEEKEPVLQPQESSEPIVTANQDSDSKVEENEQVIEEPIAKTPVVEEQQEIKSDEENKTTISESNEEPKKSGITIKNITLDGATITTGILSIIIVLFIATKIVKPFYMGFKYFDLRYGTTETKK